MLPRAAKTGGAWQRIRALGIGFAKSVAFAGDRYFVEWTDLANVSGVTTAKLSDSTPPVQLILPGITAIEQWVGTGDTFYWSDGRRIFSRSLTAL